MRLLIWCSPQVLLVYGLAFMVILPVVVVSPPDFPSSATRFLFGIPSRLVFSVFSPPAAGHLVVPLHPLQRRPDPHQHHPALHALHVQDAEHEHEAWVLPPRPAAHGTRWDVLLSYPFPPTPPGLVTVLTGAFEFDPRNNKEATTRPTDNIEVPQVSVSVSFTCADSSCQSRGDEFLPPPLVCTAVDPGVGKR